MFSLPRSVVYNDATASVHPVHPILRHLLGDLENLESRTSARKCARAQPKEASTPKFDVREVADTYELYGELPGIEQKDVDIEFVDEYTLTVRGRSARSYASDAPKAPKASNIPSATNGGTETPSKEHQASVEDDASDAGSTTFTEPDSPNEEKVEVEKPAEPKYWVSERSVGEFGRFFKFPIRVDQDTVKASMKNGILSIVVQKAKKLESRKITIS